MKTTKYNLAAVALTLAVFVIGTVSSVQAVDLIGGTNPALNNGDYSLPANFGTIGGALIGPPVSAQIGQGPWNGTSRGVLALLAEPTISINGTPNPGDGLNATISGLAAVNVLGLGLLQNGGSVFETVPGNPGNTLPPLNIQYTLTGTFSSTDTLSLALLTNSGFGFAITTGGTQGTTPTPGTDVANSINGPGTPLIGLFDANSGSFSLTYTSPTLLPTAGVRLFTGENPGLLSAIVLGDVTFDNVVLTAVAVPEPSTWALGLAGAGVLLMLARRKRGAAVS